MKLACFQESIAVLGKPFAPFLLHVQALKPQLLPCFNAVNQDASQFSIPASPWQDIAAIGFPDPISGLLPVTIMDERVLSLLFWTCTTA
jgi:hypothetical protein